MNWFISILLVSFSAMGNSNLYLKDRCSQKSTSLLTTNGLDIELSISKFDPNAKMTIRAEFFPVNSVGEHVHFAPVAFTYNYNEANGWRGVLRRRLRLPRGEFKVKLITPKNSKLIRAERKLKTSNLWMVRVSWYQRGTQYSGVTQKSFLRLKDTQPFYEVRSAGQCHWETRAAISSELYVNENMTQMSITRDYEGISNFNSNRGLNLGPSNMDGDTPLSFGNNSGFFFRDWNSSFESVGIEHLQRKWVLGRHESGIFGIRHSFTRKKARKWVWEFNETNRCHEYRIVSEGDLDIGLQTEDFYILPQYMHTTDEMNAFIEDYRPTLNTCTHSVNNNPENAQETIVNKDNTILYYYSNKDML